MFSFLIKLDSHDDLDLSLFDWMNVGSFRMLLIDLRSLVLWTSKFAELRQAIETVDRKNRSKLILQCWASLPDTFGDLIRRSKSLAFCIRINVPAQTNFFAHEVCFEPSLQSSDG